jgi:predicted nucleic acid-binding protein
MTTPTDHTGDADHTDDTDDTGGPDAALVAEAARVLGTTGRAATVDRALATVIRGRRRHEAVAAEAGRLGAGLPPAAPTASPEPPGPPDPPGLPGWHQPPGWPEAAGPTGWPVPEPSGRPGLDPPGGWLLDTSARRRSHAPRAAAALRALLAAGRLVTCPLLDLEALAGEAAGHREALARRHLAYRRVPLDDVVARRALALQAGPGAGPSPGAGVAEARALLLVATAAVHRLGVLHEDDALGRVAAACGVPQRPAGGLGGGTAA